MSVLPSLRQLSYLIAVDEHGHFGRAADASHVTQSTLSAGIRELERLLDAPLVERGRRQATLTPLGHEVARRGRDLLREAEEIVRLAQATGTTLRGTLRLGAIPTVAPFLLPRVLPRLRESLPDLRLYLREEQTVRLVEGLHEGRIDAAILALPFECGDVHAERLFSDPFVVAAPADHPFAGLDEIEVEALEGQPLLLLEDGHCMKGHALEACRFDRGAVSVEFEATSLETLVQMVASGLGVTLLPRLAIAGGIAAGLPVALRPLTDPAEARTIALVWRASDPREGGFRTLARELRPSLAELDGSEPETDQPEPAPAGVRRAAVSGP